ncbi:glycoside hydrolase family 16 protein [Curtobacterium flaccumfaciens pv. flaccumfaciens]|uniref:glycoside hydrolase family 16 protein n=1 Tax=Curtobacterium poinsettiae TaxID=159612 RepID=UPI00217CD937|nr:glycoside hydrolase family 16 protein [Curtobacterium flaccumfaciens]MCS6565868.1 glycoside hydrolase family 16 protein [Curtobacterium flaccumfaciens pv. flaccumfaciens]
MTDDQGDRQEARPTWSEHVADDAASANGAAPAHGRGLSRHRPPRRRARRAAFAVGALLAAVGIAAGTATATTTANGDDVTLDDPSGVSMPSDQPAGWTRAFGEDFADTATNRTFESRYAERFVAYHGFADTAGTGRYQASTLSTHDGLLDVRLRTTSAGVPLAGGVVPLVDGQWGGQASGRYSIRMKSDEVDGYGVAVLLWSDQNLWSDGEIDFPEGALGAPAWLNVHCLSDPAEKCVHEQTSASLADWHTYTIEWTPERMSFLVDDEVVGTTTENIPTAPMHLVVQAGSNGGDPPADAEGSLLIDWLTIDVPSAGVAPAATLPSDAPTD